MKTILNFLSLIFCLTIFGQQNAYYQQYAKYIMDIDVDAKNYSYQGKQKISYTNNSPDTLKVVYFHLYWNVFKPNSTMDQRVQSQGKKADGRLIEKKNDQILSRLASIPKNEEGNQNIHWIKQNGTILKTELQESILKVTLDKAIFPQTSTHFEMEWDAVIPKQIRRSGRNNREGIEMTMTQWYPKIAEYDYDGWGTFDYLGREFHAPFSDFDVNISIDKNYIIGAGGTLLNPKEVKGYTTNPKSIDNKSKATWKWKAKNILDFAWAADPDYSVESFDANPNLKVYLVYQKSEKTKNWNLAIPYLKEYYKLMNARFGNYVYPTYSFVQGGDGGMEYGQCTMILGEAANLNGLLGLMFHEGAHSWYQQMLATNESMYPWLDEGFTSYAENVIMHELFPPKINDEVKNAHTASINAYVKFNKSGNEEPASWLADHHDFGTAYTYASYLKGELYLVQLSYIIGNEALQKTLKTYYNLWKLKHPNGRDFLHIAQKISGMDLKWFHNYWINTTKTIDYSINSVEESAGNCKVILENKGQIPMPIDLKIIMQDNSIKYIQIPMNMTRENKKSEQIWEQLKLSSWLWTNKLYELNLPFAKSAIKSIQIDSTKRMADINPEDNFIDVK